MPTTPTLTVTDLANGNGATVTVSGADASTTNVVYRASVTGDLTNASFASVATISGNGTATVAGLGYYWWHCQSTLTGSTAISDVIYQNTTDGSKSVLSQVWDAVVARLQALNLTGIGNRVYKRILPEETAIQFPCVVVTVMGEVETQEGMLTGRDDIGYPVSVLICDTNGLGPSAPADQYTLWRQQCKRTLRYQRLPGVPLVYTCRIEPKVIVDPKAGEYQHFVTGFTARYIAREPRGFGA